MPPDLRMHGLSTRHLNWLFGTLFGFPALMGVILAFQVYAPPTSPNDNETPVALAASAVEEAPVAV